ncbi:uncharacterized protein CMU_019440 [Cryptosporidium muris RN66]|uniref:Hint domain-containing protein n=1 Tax=Cryptosporidium muris (strain RN66) TaxID=441375 RepID=B6ACD1_CRYMR|nr:uncharacterized protein CMU_019440 [Cryptosporidium muris RN66]EEA06187.1 hypothetical protein, conserved [Cryptosporidium muris RN66]|eukprot:XP_002140536.1 hypothetical protein [Cryptosporidium muris RN66]
MEFQKFLLIYYIYLWEIIYRIFPKLIIDQQIIINYSFVRLKVKGILSSLQDFDSQSFRSDWGNVISASLQVSFPTSCIGDIINMGYVSTELDEDDYGFNTNCYANSETNNLCFPGENIVLSKTRGYIPIKELKIGEHILTFDYKSLKTKYSEVIMMLHNDPNFYPDDNWIIIKYLNVDIPLILSPNHLIFKLDLGDFPQKGDCEINTTIFSHFHNIYINNKIDHFKVVSVLAKDIRIGDALIINSINGIIVSWITDINIYNVESQKYLQLKGRYSPLTKDGHLIVNNVFVSSFSKPYQWPVNIIQPNHLFLFKILKPFIFLQIYIYKISYIRTLIQYIIKFVSYFSNYKYDNSIPEILQLLRIFLAPISKKKYYLTIAYIIKLYLVIFLISNIFTMIFINKIYYNKYSLNYHNC